MLRIKTEKIIKTLSIESVYIKVIPESTTAQK